MKSEEDGLNINLRACYIQTNQAGAAGNWEKGTLNQATAVSNRERGALNQARVVLNRERGTPNRAGAVSKQERGALNQARIVSNRERGTPNRAGAAPNRHRVSMCDLTIPPHPHKKRLPGSVSCPGVRHSSILVETFKAIEVLAPVRVIQTGDCYAS
ncbi:hypothetical protein JOC34_002329 [Virgibacillus halotolerans]|nr:hypothetical protein [Virgibacillus halotolerans]